MNAERQKQMFLKNDPHAVEIQSLFNATGAAVEKLSPILRDETGQAFLRFMEMAGADIGEYLTYHWGETAKETNHAKNN